MSARFSNTLGGVAAATLVALSGAVASAEVAWRSGPDALADAELGADLNQSPTDQIMSTVVDVEAAGERHVVVRLDGPVTRGTRAELEAAGVSLLNYLGRSEAGVTYFASLSIDGVQADDLLAAGVTAFTRVNPENKLHPTLAAGDTVPWAVVSRDAGDDERGEPQPINGAEDDPIVALNVMFHGDVDAAGEGAQAIEEVGGTVQTRLRSVRGVVAHVPQSKVMELAKHAAIMWMEPPIPRLTDLNAEARQITEAEIVQSAPYNLDGSGVTVMIYDGGTLFDGHSDLTGRVYIGDSDGTSDHATHVAGTVGADGTASSGLHRGMAPGVEFVSYGFEVTGGLSPGFLYTDPGDLEADYTDAFFAQGADIANNSIGSNVEPNGYSCSWQGDYGTTAAVLDAVVRGSLGAPIRTVWAAGNERTGSRCNVEGFGDFYSMAPPQGAKNQISVGAINANNDSMTSFSSWGPTDDGRLRPDVVGPGCSTAGDGGITSTSSSGGYNVKCGTSMASPAVTGVSSLLIQEHRALRPGEPDFRNSTLKAILAHTAWDLGNPGPDYSYGYGSVRAQAAVDFMRTENYVEESVEQGSSFGAVAVVEPGDAELKITIAWDDAPGTPNVVGSLVNDLDLIVTSPSGQRFYPWTLDPANPSAPAVQNQPDSVNNVEQVQVDNPEAGVWLIEVDGSVVPDGPQPFSMTVTPFLRNCTDAGVVQVQGNLFSCSGTANIAVNDCGLNTDDSVIETAEVTVSSDSDPVGLPVVLDEEAAGAARFGGEIQLSSNGAAGTLLVSPGDTIYVEYFDADDGEGNSGMRMDTAMIDCTSPVISGVQVVDLEPRSAAVSFDTDEPTSVTVTYGSACGSLSESVSSGGLNTTHTVDISGLLDDVTYFYTVEAVDEAGNIAVAGQAPRCFSFTTPEVPDFYTAEVSGTFSQQFTTITYIPNSSNPAEFYTACETEALTLPVNPAGGAVLDLGDDNFEEVNLSTPVPFYGQSYSTIYVGSNGYITFNSGDTDRSESLDDHFEQPRISGVFDDLDVSDGGTVSYKELSDRLVVTYDAVAEWNSSDFNTFQVEMFYDGRVQVTYGQIESLDFITGLSAGNGVDPDFLESPFGTYGACGPQPPSPRSDSISTIAFDSVEFDLRANDDGLPEGGSLIYRITKLPDNGYLADVDAAGEPLISTVPYDLAGDTVRYAALSDFTGADSIEFRADDGGQAPDGGESPNVGVIDIEALPTDQIPAFSFLVDDTNPGWTGQAEWGFGSPVGNDGDPTSGFTGDNVLGYNLNGPYSNSMPERFLTSGALDMSTVNGATLRFQRWLSVESSSFDNAAVRVSTDGTNWEDVWVHDGPTIQDAQWVTQEFDISAIADGESSVFLRFVMGATDFSVTYGGWNVDDIEVLKNAPPPCDGDVDASGGVDGADLVQLLSNFGQAAAGRSGGDIDDDGAVDGSDLVALLAAFGDSCG